MELSGCFVIPAIQSGACPGSQHPTPFPASKQVLDEIAFSSYAENAGKNIFNWMISKKKIIRIITGVCIASPLIYIFSYSFILPLLEHYYLGPVGYVVYEPVEILRNHCVLFYRITEKGYKRFGGKVTPQERRIFKGCRRRIVHFHENGKVSLDSLYLDGEQVSCFSYYPDGKKLSIFSTDPIILKKWYKNGCLAYEDVDNGKGSGYIKWYDRSGKIIAECETKNLFLWSGTFLIPVYIGSGDIPPPEKLAYYEKGRIIKTVDLKTGKVEFIKQKKSTNDTNEKN